MRDVVLNYVIEFILQNAHFVVPFTIWRSVESCNAARLKHEQLPGKDIRECIGYLERIHLL